MHNISLFLLEVVIKTRKKIYFGLRMESGLKQKKRFSKKKKTLVSKPPYSAFALLKKKPKK